MSAYASDPDKDPEELVDEVLDEDYKTFDEIIDEINREAGPVSISSVEDALEEDDDYVAWIGRDEDGEPLTAYRKKD